MSPEAQTQQRAEAEAEARARSEGEKEEGGGGTRTGGDEMSGNYYDDRDKKGNNEKSNEEGSEAAGEGFAGRTVDVGRRSGRAEGDSEEEERNRMEEGSRRARRESGYDIE